MSSKENSILIEEIGVLIEERAFLSPLAARIYATLILESDEGLTFEAITELHKASKSSVSNNLKVLVKLKYISYYTKPGNRKRYFKASKFYVKTAMENYAQLFEKEIEVIDKINGFNKTNHPEKFYSKLSEENQYQSYLKKIQKEFKNKIEQANKFEHQH